jgi:thiol-disulfide isomerase/thioredoxin
LENGRERSTFTRLVSMHVTSMYQLKYYACILLIFFSLLSFSQQQKEIKLPITSVNGYGPFQPEYSFLEFVLSSPLPADYPLYKVMSNLEFRKIPSTLKSVEKGLIVFDFQQFLYQNVQGGDVSKDIYTKLQNERGFRTDEGSLSRQPIDCYILVIKGTDETGKEVLLLDTDHDSNFDDETKLAAADYVSRQSFEELINKSIRVNFQTVFESKVISRSIPLLILKNHEGYIYSFPEYAVAELKLNGHIYPIAISSEFRFPNYWATNIAYLSYQKISIDSVVRKNQYLLLNSLAFKNKGVDLNSLSLVLEEADPSAPGFYGTQKGMRPPPFKGKDVITGKELSLNDFKGKYLFIDFWGSWCVNCIPEIPRLSAIYSSMDKSKVAFLGIAGRDNISSLRNMISKMNIAWPNILSDSLNQIVEKYSIEAYPSGILIDTAGKVVETGVVAFNLEGLLAKYVKPANNPAFDLGIRSAKAFMENFSDKEIAKRFIVKPELSMILCEKKIHRYNEYVDCVPEAYQIAFQITLKEKQTAQDSLPYIFSMPLDKNLLVAKDSLWQKSFFISWEKLISRTYRFNYSDLMDFIRQKGLRPSISFEAEVNAPYKFYWFLNSIPDKNGNMSLLYQIDPETGVIKTPS